MRVTWRLLFSIATTPRCRGSATSSPRWLQCILDPYLIMLSAKQGGIKYHFWVFGMTRPGIEPRSSGQLANTLLIRPMAQYYATIFITSVYIYTYMFAQSIHREQNSTTRSIFNSSNTGLNLLFSFSWRSKNTACLILYSIAGVGIVGFILFRTY